MDRNALIAYIYDLYSVEQAIAQIKNELGLLAENKTRMKKKNSEKVEEIRKDRSKQLEKIESSFQSNLKKIKKPILQKEIYETPSVLKNLIIGAMCCGLGYLLGEIFDSDLFGLFMFVGYVYLLIAVVKYCYIWKKTDKAEHDMLQRMKDEQTERHIKAIEYFKEETEKAVSSEEQSYQTALAEILPLKEAQTKQLKDFEALRYDLYDKLKLIPAPHQNLYSVCYVYKYLITSRETDLNYIFTQLNLEKIIDQLKGIARDQQEMIIIQREIMAESKKHTNLLGRINMQLDDFRGDFNGAMSAIQSNLTDITDNQRSILNNQATMYRAYLETAKQQAQSQEEAADYVKMIEQNTEVNAMFQRAEFLGLNMDRNYSGNY